MIDLMPVEIRAQFDAAIEKLDPTLLPGDCYRVMLDHIGCKATPGGPTPTCRVDLLPPGVGMQDLLKVSFEMTYRAKKLMFALRRLSIP